MGFLFGYFQYPITKLAHSISASTLHVTLLLVIKSPKQRRFWYYDQMKVSPNQILPSQDFLKAHTIHFIVESINKGELEKLPPSPIVRKDDSGRLIAIDGHNLIAVRCQRNEEIEVHLAHSADDGLPNTSEANIQRNKDLKAKYNSVLLERLRLHEQGIDSFKDLIDRYPDLF
jgi:hypothetical protein